MRPDLQAGNAPRAERKAAVGPIYLLEEDMQTFVGTTKIDAIIRDIQAAGHTSLNAIAGQLNVRTVATANGGSRRVPKTKGRNISKRPDRRKPVF